MSTYKVETYNALLACIQENQSSLYRLAYSYVKSRNTALDLVQEAVYRALRSSGEIQTPDHVKSWLYRVLINLCIDELRREKRVEPADPGEMPEESADPLDGQAEQMDLRNALEQLKPEIKTVITLRYFEDMKLSEIAELLGENLNSVKSRLYRGLKALRLELEEEGFAHE